MTELAQRAVACKGWRWMPGMLAVDVGGLKWRQASGSWVGEGHAARTCRGEITPDLPDPATLGCLLALVREACPGTFVMPYDKKPGWWIAIMPGEIQPLPGPTYAEALVAALEAAP